MTIAKYGNRYSKVDLAMKCFLCNPNKKKDEACQDYSECIRGHRATLPDKSVRMLKNLDILAGYAPSEGYARSLLELDSKLDQAMNASQPTCTDPSEPAFV